MPHAFAGGNVGQQSSVPVHVRSVVRADSRGRLVRSFVVSAPIVQPRLVEAADVSAGAARSSGSAAGSIAVPEIVETAAKKYDVDPLLVHSVIQVESAYNPRAVSAKGAQGIMQLMPGTARRFGVNNAFDARDNIEGGVRYLKYLQTLFPDDPRLAIAAYNAGEAAVWKYNNQIPPYRETEQYVYQVGRRYGQARRQAEKKRATQTASAATPAAPAVPAGPAYTPVQYFVDGEGRLHMRTVDTPEEVSAGEAR